DFLPRRLSSGVSASPLRPFASSPARLISPLRVSPRLPVFSPGHDRTAAQKLAGTKAFRVKIRDVSPRPRFSIHRRGRPQRLPSTLPAREGPNKATMNCPGCNREVIEGKSTCPFCGLIFAKWRGADRRAPGERPSPFPAPAPPAATLPSTVATTPPALAELEPESVTEKFKGPAYLIGILAALAA